MKIIPTLALTLAVATAAGLYMRNVSRQDPPAAGNPLTSGYSVAPAPAVERMVPTAVHSPSQPVPAFKAASLAAEAPPVPAVAPPEEPVKRLAAVTVFQAPLPTNPIPPTPTPRLEPPSFTDESSGFAALELAQNMQGMERINMVREGITRLANFDLDTAVQAANSLTNQHDHGVAVGSVVRIANERSPRQAADILFNQVPPETALGLIQYPRTAPLMQNLLEEQLRNNPMSVERWVQSVGSARDEVATRQAQGIVTSAWVRSDPSAAAAWVNTLPAGAGRDQALQALANLSVVDNSAAIEWSRSGGAIPNKTLEATEAPKKQ